MLLPSLKSLLLKTKSILHIDETWCRVRIVKEEFKNGRYFKKYIWVLANKIEKVVYFLYDNDADDSRGTRPISEFLDSFIGGIQTDVYSVYRFFADLNKENERSLCRAHVRAEFKYASNTSKDKDTRIHFGDMMNTAHNYMINEWKDLLNYRHDGRYDIDNTEAERKIRPLTIGRKNTLFFGSEEGVEVVTTYYTFI